MPLAADPLRCATQGTSEGAPLHCLRVVPSGVRHELPVLLHWQARPHGQPADGAGVLGARVTERVVLLVL